jgi:hypothetical protein
LSRFGLTRFRFDLRARSFTVYGFALLLLGIGFFLAGVPLGNSAVESPPAETAANDNEVGATSIAESGTTEFEGLTPSSELPLSPDIEESNGDEVETDSADSPSGTTGSGAFAGLPTPEAGEAAITSTSSAELAGTPVAGELSTTSALTTTVPLTATEGISEIAGSTIATEEQTAATPTAEPPSPTPTASPSTTPTMPPTPSPSATPTETPPATALPTATPTPIDQPTAVIGVGTSTLWVRRTPGGQNLSLLRSGDTVILLAGHANYGGLRWQQVSTLDGVIGWVQEGYLDLGETSQATQ